MVKDLKLHYIVPQKTIFSLKFTEKKHWYLYPPKNDIFLTPPITKSPYFYSDFNPDNPDYKKFPTARFLTTYECVLRPGDILYNPPLWWHQVKNLNHSIGVGFRWFNPLNSIKASFRRDFNDPAFDQPTYLDSY